MNFDARAACLGDYFAPQRSTTLLRPLITSLNNDNSWLWSFPRPRNERHATGRVYYHVVFEPWLVGPTSLWSSWFINLEHASTPAAAAGASDVEAIIKQIEVAAALALQRDGKPTTEHTEYPIDAIVIGFEGLDHTHEPTLRTFRRTTHVVGTQDVVSKIRTYNHFENFFVMPDVTADSRSWCDPELRHPGGLPSWLTPLRIPGHHYLNYCFALIWSHKGADGEDTHETIMQSPHGTRLDCGPLQAFLDSQPQTQKLALFHGLKESSAFGSKNTFGAEAGLALSRRLGGTKYWILSHDSALKYSGIVMKLGGVCDTRRDLDWAIEKTEDNSGLPNLVDVGNGGIFVLE